VVGRANTVNGAGFTSVLQTSLCTGSLCRALSSRKRRQAADGGEFGKRFSRLFCRDLALHGCLAAFERGRKQRTAMAGGPLLEQRQPLPDGFDLDAPAHTVDVNRSRELQIAHGVLPIFARHRSGPNGKRGHAVESIWVRGGTLR
jgi:hypothetical protein